MTIVALAMLIGSATAQPTRPTSAAAATAPATQPAGENAAAIVETMRQELAAMAGEYPELAGLANATVREDGEGFWRLEYVNDCRLAGKGRMEDTGPRPVAITLCIMTRERFTLDVRRVQMPMPDHQWKRLDLVGWSSTYTGRGATEGVAVILDKALAAALERISAMDRPSAVASRPAAG